TSGPTARAWPTNATTMRPTIHAPWTPDRSPRRQPPAVIKASRRAGAAPVSVKDAAVRRRNSRVGGAMAPDRLACRYGSVATATTAAATATDATTGIVYPRVPAGLQANVMVRRTATAMKAAYAR